MPYSVSLSDKHEHSMNSIKRQRRLSARYSLPLIVVNTLIPIELVKCEYNNKLYELAVSEIEKKLASKNALIIELEIDEDNTGYEATYVVKGISATELKRLMMEIENTHPLGRLINLDVIAASGNVISRKACHLPPRGCIICNRAACYCATHHAHSPSELHQYIKRMVEDYFALEMVG